MKPSIPFLRARKQKSGRVYYYFEQRIETGGRTEKPLGADLDTALAHWQQLMRAPEINIPQSPTLAWLIERYGMEQLPLIKPLHKQRHINLEIDRLNRFFSKEKNCNLTEISHLVAQQYAEDARHLRRAQRDWSLLAVIAKWAHRNGYLQHTLDIPSLGITGEIKQQERDELRQLLLERVSEEESQALRSASQDLSRSHASKRIFESARLKAIQRAKGRKRKDLVLALERFSWTDFQQTQG